MKLLTMQGRKVNKMISEIDIRDMQSDEERNVPLQAAAWVAVVNTLYEIDPYWFEYGYNGVQAACNMIKSLAKEAGHARV